MDTVAVRKDFPTLRTDSGVYLDSACQSLRPDSVVQAVTEYYTEYPACGGRSVHRMSNEVTLRVDEAREAFCELMNGADPSRFVFTKNTTEAINTVASGLGLKKDDAVVTTDVEHNSNYVPWLCLRDRIGIKMRRSVSRDDGTFDIESFKNAMENDVRIVSVGHVSNVTGAAVPLRDICEIAHDRGALVMADGAQAAPHMKVDLKGIGVDLYAFSLHKMLGPSGMGILYGAPGVLEHISPLTAGGGTVGLVTYDGHTDAPIPDRFEAGLQDYAGIFGAKAAAEYLMKVGMDEIRRHDSDLMRYMTDSIGDIRGLSLVGPSEPDKRSSVLSFNIDGLNAHDIAMMLDSADGIMIRSGMHCAHCYLDSRGIKGCARASVYLYNDRRDIDRFSNALHRIASTFGRRRSVPRPLRASLHPRNSEPHGIRGATGPHGVPSRSGP